MKRVRLRVLLNAPFGLIYCCDYRFPWDKRAIRELKLWIYRPKVAGWPHKGTVSSKHEQRAGTLGLIWHDYRELPTSRSNLPEESKRGFAVPTRGG